MSIEGMWAAYFGDVDGKQLNSGIVVLETGRLFGGDSYIAYLGKYQIGSGRLGAVFETWAFNPTIVVSSAFGEVGPSRQTCALEGELSDDGSIRGHVWRHLHPDLKLPLQMTKISDLP